MFCTNCGKEIPDKSRFCVSCGKESTRSKKYTKDLLKKIGVVLSVIFLVFSSICLYRFLLLKRLKSSERPFQELTRQQEESGLIEPGIFLEGFENFILYVSDVEGNKLKNIFVYEVNENGGMGKITFAKKGEFIVEENTLKLKLEEGVSDETDPQNRDKLYKLNFKTFFKSIPIKKTKTTKANKRPSNMDLEEFQEQVIKYLKEMGEPLDQQEIQQHVANESLVQRIKLNIAQNESKAQETLKLISVALENYAADHRGAFPSSLSDLVQTQPPYLDKNYVAQSPIEGYNYSYSKLESSGYSCSAVPVKVGSTGIMGKRSFRITTGGIMENEE